MRLRASKCYYYYAPDLLKGQKELTIEPFDLYFNLYLFLQITTVIG